MESTIDALSKLHDASLLTVRFDLLGQACVLELIGGPSLPGHYELEFSGVTAFRASSKHSWGRSNSILEARAEDGGEVVFNMQSGDTVAVTSLNIPFKLTPLRGAAQLKR